MPARGSQTQPRAVSTRARCVLLCAVKRARYRKYGGAALAPRFEERSLKSLSHDRSMGSATLGAFRALAPMVLFLSMRRLPWVEYKPRMGYRICDGSRAGETRTLSLRSRLGFRAKSKPSRRLWTG